MGATGGLVPLSPDHVNWTGSGIIEPKPGGWKTMAGRRNVAQLVVCNCGARRILVVSTDDDWVASPVPGQAAKTDKIVPGFEFGKIHFRSEGRRAVLDLSIACGR